MVRAVVVIAGFNANGGLRSEVSQALIDPSQKRPTTIHHHGYGKFVVDGKTVPLKLRKPGLRMHDTGDFPRGGGDGMRIATKTKCPA